ncbi:metallophosphoesterase family protein [Alteribacter keqinensis]|uniref:DNA repair exonuclease n=1 Tax=Alteribacter keqinensis TaxID=2483800 RepID=A0A3M7TTC0_9BACI|nr:DNA repair exonuclease [Alteribacter keqinensis]RNA68693.1 DNA repair exonuclease [Alteribacter keqinensis]
MDMIRFIHCADLHLDRPYETSQLPEKIVNRLKKSAYYSFEKLISQAIEREVDFVLISGDLYDLEHRSLKGQLFVKKQAERLLAEGISLYIVHGNHDPLTEGTKSVALPENVTVFGPRTTSVLHTNKGVRLYGFSYENRSVTANRIEEYIKEKRDDAMFHIALLHGQELSQPEHDPYAPFRLKELTNSPFDYWALGHIHKRQILSREPLVVYPGNIQGGHRNEEGPKGAFYVELTKQGGELTFLDTSEVDWHNVTLSIAGVDSVEALLSLAEEALDKAVAEGKCGLVHLSFTGCGPLHSELNDPAVMEDFLEELRGDEETLFAPFIWVQTFSLKTSPDIDRQKAKEQSDVLGDVLTVIDEYTLDGIEDGVLRDLYRHRTIRKYLTSLSEKEKAELLGETEQWLVSRLLKEEA